MQLNAIGWDLSTEELGEWIQQCLFSSLLFRREIQKGAGKWGKDLTYGDQW